MPWLLSNVYSLSVFYREKRADLLHLSATFFFKKNDCLCYDIRLASEFPTLKLCASS
jgi:hypothetical protein